MPSSLLSSAKDIIGQQGRDYTQLVRQVKDILPQFSDDQVCDALVQSEEDISRAVELLMTQEPMTKSKKKDKKKEKEKEKAQEEHVEMPSYGYANHSEKPEDVVPEVRDERPKTQAEKEAAKLRKKLREIERIEEKLARGEKVDPLQLPKLQKKAETDEQLRDWERIIAEEEEVRRWEQEHPPAWAASAGDVEVWTEPPVEPEGWEVEAPGSDTHQTIRTEILNMLHKGPQESSHSQYEHSKQIANQLSAGGKNIVHSSPMGSQWQPSMHYASNYRSERSDYRSDTYGQYQYGQSSRNHGHQGNHGHQEWRQQQWQDSYWKNSSEQTPPEKPPAGPGGEVKGDWANMYSTPLDVSSIPEDKRAEAERIANEIEQSSGGGDWSNPAPNLEEPQKGKGKGKGKGKKGKDRQRYGKPSGKDREADQWKEPKWQDWGPPGL